jgi:hypothetical protein
MITLDTIPLPADLIWTDEFDWSPVQQSASYTLSGALIVETGTKLKGRPITLSGSDTSGWISRASLLALSAKLSTVSAMTLILNDGRIFNVTFRNSDKPIDAKQIIDFNNPDNADMYSLTVRLLVI